MEGLQDFTFCNSAIIPSCNLALGRRRTPDASGILGGMPSAPKLSKSERAAARLKKKKSGPSAVKRAAARQALQAKKQADTPGEG